MQEAANKPAWEQNELHRVEGEMLPNAITWIAHLALLAAAIIALAGAVPLDYVLAVAVALSAPFLYGFADMVRSLRTIARKSLGG